MDVRSPILCAFSKCVKAEFDWTNSLKYRNLSQKYFYSIFPCGFGAKTFFGGFPHNNRKSKAILHCWSRQG